MKHSFKLEDGGEVQIEVERKENCTTVSQRFTDSSGNFLTKTCTVTCNPPGKSYSWTCNDDQSCYGDCSDPNNPTGHCY